MTKKKKVKKAKSTKTTGSSYSPMKAEGSKMPTKVGNTFKKGGMVKGC